MKGTEKQIKWATEILETVTGIFEDTISFMETLPDDPRKAGTIAETKRRMELVKTAEDAGDIIDLFKDVHRTGNVQADFASLTRIYRFTSPVTTGQRKILCK